MNQRWLGNLALLGVAAAWGTMIPVITHLSERWDPFFLAMSRYVLAVPVLYTALWIVEGPARQSARPALWRVLATGWLGLGSFAFLFTFGVAHANPVIAAVLAAANPIISALVGRVFFGVPMERAMLPAIVLAVVGCALASIDWRAGQLELTLRGGEFVMLVAAGCWAWYSLAIHRWLNAWSQLRIAAHTMAAAAPLMLAGYGLAIVVGWAHWAPPLPGGWDGAIFAWMVVGPVVLGLLLWNFGVSRVGIMVAALFVNLSPVVAVGLLALGGRTPTGLQIFGGLLVLGGVVWCEGRVIWQGRCAGKVSQE